MRAPRAADLQAAGESQATVVDAAGGDGVLDVGTVQQQRAPHPRVVVQRPVVVIAQELVQVDVEQQWADAGLEAVELGRASCRERVCQYVYISVGAVSLTKKRHTHLKQT